MLYYMIDIYMFIRPYALSHSRRTNRQCLVQQTGVINILVYKSQQDAYVTEFTDMYMSL